MSDAAAAPARRGTEASAWPSTVALAALVALAVLAPWPFGAVQPWATRLLTLVALGVALVALVGASFRGLVLGPVRPWPLLCFLGLGLIQLAPLPAELHAVIAPGSAVVWHPSGPLTAAVLGSGPRPISVDPDTTVRALALVGGLGLLALLAAPALSRPRSALTAAAVVVVGGALLASYGIFARARFGTLLYGRIPVPTINPFGPFVSKNHFAGYVTLACLVGFGLALGLAERHRQRHGADGGSSAAVAAVVASLSMALAVLVSLSRGGVVALLSGIAALVLVRWSLRHGTGGRVVPSLVFGAIVAALLALALPGEAHRRLQTLDSTFRLDTWRDVLRMAAGSPVVGQGLGAFHDAFPRYKRGHGEIRVEHAENDYLETLAEGGLLGLGVGLSALIALATGAWRGLRGGGHPLPWGLGMGALSALVALAVHSAFDFNLRIPSNAALAAFAAALALAAAAAGLRPEPRSRATTLGLALVPVLLLALVLRLPQDGAAQARAEVRTAATADTPEVRALRLERAEGALRHVLGRRPAHAESWLLLAAVRADRGDPAGAQALARHAASLDPQRKEMQAAAERLGAGR